MPLHSPVAAPPPTATRQSAPALAALSRPRRASSIGTWLIASGSRPAQRSPICAASRSPSADPARRGDDQRALQRRARSTSARRPATCPGPNTTRGGVALKTPPGLGEVSAAHQSTTVPSASTAELLCGDLRLEGVLGGLALVDLDAEPGLGRHRPVAAGAPHRGADDVVVPAHSAAHLLLDHEVRGAHGEVQRGRARRAARSGCAGRRPPLRRRPPRRSACPPAARRCG